MSIEALKEQARRHEQKEKWDKALDLYMQAIEQLEANDQPDISLYNRAGDLNTRIGSSEKALSCYNRAIDLYLEAELPNNAIAVCKKIIRNVPGDASSYLRMGQIRADQGFMVDARANYISYAEKVDPDEALRALEEFADRAGDDHEIRMLLAAQMEQMERNTDAAIQLVKAHRTMTAKGMDEEAAGLEPKIAELDPEVSLDSVPADGAPEMEEAADEELDFAASFGAVDLDGGDDDEEALPEAEVGAPSGYGEVELDRDDVAADEGRDLEEDLHEESDEELEELPMMSFDDDGSRDLDEEEANEDAPVRAEDEAEEPEAVGASESVESSFEDAAAELEAAAAELAGFEEDDEVEIGGVSLAGEDDDEEEEAEELPIMSFDDDEEEEVAEADEVGEDVFNVDELEGVGDFDAAELDDDEEELPMMTFDEDDGDEEAGEADALAQDVAEFDAVEFDEAGDEDLSGDIAGAFADADETGHELEVEAAEAEQAEATPDPSRAAAAMDDAVEEELAAEAPEYEQLAEAGDASGALEALDAAIARSPDDPELRQRRVELAFKSNDDSALSESYFGLATVLEAEGDEARAKSVYRQAVQADPENADAKAALTRLEGAEAAGAEAEEPTVAASEDYVDLGGMILDSEPTEKTTRFVVAYEEPSGDEQADFKKMLAQFKEKVTENVDADDVTAHYDLGTAYKEMGLLDEAIHQYQQALRASADHLPTYEMLGQTFLEKGQNEAAVRSLTRALDAKYTVEDELMGIYYYLGRAHEELGNTDQALEFYDRVFTLDINFADVTERLRVLRP